MVVLPPRVSVKDESLPPGQGLGESRILLALVEEGCTAGGSAHRITASTDTVPVDVIGGCQDFWGRAAACAEVKTSCGGRFCRGSSDTSSEPS